MASEEINMTTPKRLYETERKRQQRARKQAGQVHKVVVYLTNDQKKRLDAYVADARLALPGDDIDAGKYIARWCI